MFHTPEGAEALSPYLNHFEELQSSSLLPLYFHAFQVFGE